MPTSSRPVARTLVSLALVVALLAPRTARADDNDKARDLDKRAMGEDYLATDFDKALDKLQKALAICKQGCTNQTRAILHRDVGVVDVGGGLGRDKAVKNFVEALKLDPTIALDPDVKTKEIEAAFNEAKKTVGASAPAATPGGDFDHTPATEQTVHTPLPIYAEYKGTEAIAKVVARYRGASAGEWKSLDLQKSGNGYAGTVPCTDVQLGEFHYYIQAFSAENEPIANSGDRKTPFTVAIKTQIAGPAPALPGQSPPAQCADVGDCPPGFPCAKTGGEDGAPTGKPEGDECALDSECGSGKCEDNKCSAPKAEHSKFYVGFGASLDLTFLSSANDVCKLGSSGAASPSGYYCTTTSGADYPPDKATNSSLGQGDAGKVASGGATLGSIRLYASGDYAATENILVGARLGVGIRSTFPGQFGPSGVKPFFGEARFTYLFGDKPLVATIAPYVVAAAGVAEVDGEIDVNVKQGSGSSAKELTVQAWQTGGPIFVGGGAGARFALTNNVGLLVTPLRANFAFGGSGTAFWLAPEIGMQFGL